MSRPLLTIYALGLAACALAAAWLRPPAAASVLPAHEVPREWNGRALRPLALGEVEQRFARRFPGQIARLTDGRQQLVWRTVHEPTRMLHPASDCYRGAGYTVGGERLEADAQQRHWRCFIAERGGQRLRVCERIEDAEGRAFTDSSSWFWAALSGRSHGPWQAVTTAQGL